MHQPREETREQLAAQPQSGSRAYGLAAEAVLLLTLPVPSTAIAADALPAMRGGIALCLPALLQKLSVSSAAARPSLHLRST